ncbi:39S ribosomal protein L38, mitochondrial [Leptopilina heterotoma]|uniref:39S ribosomal protein L38, mitochondrial n=1 Tax=Leptopilina heterotoma TaxID=63436 RepID=UPI001CA9C6CF|nr:39S ribosomal protein L38, mitochondrial [Leptopilina heterotoma]
MSKRLFHNLHSCFNQQIRYMHRICGNAPTIARSLNDRLRELNYRDPEIHFKVDIGLPIVYNKELRGEKVNEVKKKNSALHAKLDLRVAKNDWLKTTAPLEIRKIAEHYGIFNDLFGDAYFHPTIPLTIDYNVKDMVAKVSRGNFITARDTLNEPTIKYRAEPNTLWSLLLTTPDGNLSKSNLEICHWFIGNIPGDSIEKGDLMLNYMRPIPPRGIGYCRYIFILYKQDKRIDFSEYRKSPHEQHFCLVDRNWNTLDFYRKHQDYITPVGLSFFQTEWDASLIDFYHNVLEMRSPSFEYDFPKPYIKPQVWFPVKQPFNIYMDKYRDTKDIQKQYFMKKLKTIHPFKEDKGRPKYPNAIPYKRDEYIPSWLKLEMKKERLSQGRYREVFS